MKKGDFKCTYCDGVFNEELESKEREPGTRKAMCWDCYKRNYMIQCELCEEHFRNNSKPGKFYFVVMPNDVRETGMKSGIYRAHRFPVWSSDMFSCTINKENVDLITPLDKFVLQGDGHTNEICPECFKKYTNENWLKNKKKAILLDAVRETIRSSVSKVILKQKGDFKYFNKLLGPVINSINKRSKMAYRKLNNP
jgi:hypothetical protein